MAKENSIKQMRQNVILVHLFIEENDQFFRISE